MGFSDSFSHIHKFSPNSISMATSSNVLCGVCDARHITKCADHWCPECEEGLCSSCQEHHSLSKGTRSHGIIPVHQYEQLSPDISGIAHHCKDHGIKYTNYCQHHDQMCCPVCISTTHTDCKGFLSLQEIIKTAKTSTLLDTMEQSLNDIENNIEKVIQDREHNLSNIRQQRQKFYDNVKKLRDKINSKLDTMEQNVTTELNAAEKQIQTKIQNLVNRLSKERKYVLALKNNIKTLKENASDLQTFLGSKTYQPEVEKAEKYMKSLSEEGSLAQMNLKCSISDKIIETLATSDLGFVSIETGPPSFVLKTEKDKQAQNMVVIPQPSPKPIYDIKLSLFHTYNIPKPNMYDYRGCVIHPSGTLIITDRGTSKLIIIKDYGTVQKICCSSCVNDVTTIDDRTVAVSTIVGIDFINIDSKQTEKVIKTSNWCYGITHHKGTLLWCELSTGIQRMGLSDGSITTLVKQDGRSNYSYITTHGDKIFQTKSHTKTVTCYTMNGDRLWEYTNRAGLKDPTGITVDSDGNIYVTSHSSNDVVVIRADGKEGRQLLSQTDGLYKPWGIYYDKSKNNVLIVNQTGPAFLYHVS